MERPLKNYLRLSLILAWLSFPDPMCLAGAAEPALEITLHVSNYAHVDSEIVVAAEQRVTRIYGQLGVVTVWLDDLLLPEDDPANSLCHRMADIHVTILPRAMEGLRLQSNALGSAPADGLYSHWAYVFYDRVESLFARQVASVAQGKVSRWATSDQILAYVITHEVGHLLGLPHTPAGIMRAVWDSNDLLDAAHGDLRFNSPQAATIRSEARIRREEFLQSCIASTSINSNSEFLRVGNRVFTEPEGFMKTSMNFL